MLTKNSSTQDQGSHDLYRMGIELALQCQCQRLKYGQQYRLEDWLATYLEYWQKIFVTRASGLLQRPLIENELEADFFLQMEI